MGFAQFTVETTGSINPRVDEITPDFDGGGLLSGAVGIQASDDGYGADGIFTAASLNDASFGGLTDGPDLTGIVGFSAVKFTEIENKNKLDFLIKNNNPTADFILDSIHFDLWGYASNKFTIQYLANSGSSNLRNMETGAVVSNLAYITVGDAAGVLFSSTTSLITNHDVQISAQLAGGVKLATGDQASFRITVIGSPLGGPQLDNLAISGVFATAVTRKYCV